MGLMIEPLGKYVRLVDERNTDMITASVLGISIDKYFMPSVANVIGTDLSNYKLLRKGRFACNPMHVGRDGRLPVSRYTEDLPAIVSPAYYMFEIIDENKIEPEYLMLCFRRPDFDRMCWFRTDASVRGGITWDDVCALTIPVPSIDEQRKLVHAYQVITNRVSLIKQINQNLETQLTAMYHNIFDDPSNFTEGIVADLGEVVGGATPSTDIKDYFCDNGIVWLSPRDLTSTGLKFIYRGDTCITDAAYKSCSTKIMPAGTVLLTSRAPVGAVAIAMVDMCTNQGFKSIIPKDSIGTAYVYYFLKENRQLLESHSSGTTFMEISGNVLKGIPASIPTVEAANSFSKLCQPLFDYQRQNELEIAKLQDFCQVLVNSISCC